MLFYFVHRFFYMVIVMALLSIVSFIIIQLPPGDYITSYVASLEAEGTKVDDAMIISLKRQYGLDQPVHVQYLKWIWNMLHGDFGRSFAYGRPVKKIIGERLTLTMIISLCSLIFTYIMAIPIGIYSAVRQYSITDYTFMVVGFIGLATPNFMLALVLMYIAFKYLGVGTVGLFSPQYVTASWSLAKFINMLGHMWIPVIVIGTAGTCGLIRVMRGCLLDELRKQYVITARAKGVKQRRLLFKYPVRIAINPIISTVGWTLPGIVSGATITAVVLNLPTTGSALLRALLVQDMYLAGAMLMFLSFLTVIGTLISDVLLVLVDPRIRYEKKE